MPKIIVRTESANFWWGIYGFCDQVVWEDLALFDENEKRIGKVCLHAKSYLRDNMEALKKDPEEKKFVEAIETYLLSDTYHYWYYYDTIGEEDFYEVSYNAPKNEHGVKPRFLDIWHPDEQIGISTVESGIRDFAREFLGLEHCKIEMVNVEPFKESLDSFQEHRRLFGNHTPVTISFSEEVVEQLGVLWNKSKDEVRQILQQSIS